MSEIDGYVLLPGEGREIPMGAFTMHVLSDAAGSGGAFTLLEADEPPGFGPPIHVHEDCAEAFYVLQGEYVIFLGDQEFLCPAGSYVYIPQGAVHGFRVGRVPSRKLNLYSPAAMVAYFDGLAAAAAQGATLDDEALVQLAEESHIRVLGPVPEGYA
jgi:mannose-6-phosphate isomerase-like protein (cupin superfamily)